MEIKNTGRAVIVGAGPAGLTAARELLDKTDICPVVFEQSDTIGGISQTVRYKGNRIDIGGHRFFSKSSRVADFWERFMPMQGAPAKDDRLIGKQKLFAEGGPNPEQQDNVMLKRERVSRIYYLRHFFDYPISLRWQTFANMGLWRTLKAGFGYVAAIVVKKPETSLENFYINRFGRSLYRMFFEDYTEKVWGVHPSKLGADWGSQRVKGLSVLAIFKDMLKKSFGIKHRGEVETSLIEEFLYPKLGPGQLWESVADDVVANGGKVHKQAQVVSIHVGAENLIDYVDIEYADGCRERQPCQYLLSSMPIKELIAAIQGIAIPEDIRRIAADLPYRDFITVGLLVKQLSMQNRTAFKTYKDRIPDTWIYIQERDVKIGRLQIFNNWSPYMVADYENTMWIGLEYFCTEGDEMWQMSKEDFIAMAIRELESIGFIRADEVLDSTQIKIRKAYPSYFGSYYELDKVKAFLDTIGNLYCIGRNGQHRYNNMDHSMLTAMAAVDAICHNSLDKTAVWTVNTENEYHEKK